MNSKYLGNSLDLMKYDLLTFLIRQSPGRELFYIPMLTEPKPKERNPKYETYEIGALNVTLLKLMKREYQKEYSDIKVVRKYFINSGIDISMFAPKGMKHFNEESRKDYFSEAVNHYKSLTHPTLVYVDPDVGSDIGISRRFRSNKQMYIRKHELVSLQQNLRKDGVLSFFQHLGDASQKVQDRVKDLTEAFGPYVLFVAYTRIQAAFVFICTDEATYTDQRKLIEQYYQKYAHLKHSDRFIITSGNHSKSGGFLL